jgi:hypothetical protein
MADYACMVQAGQVSESQQARLAAGLDRIAGELLGAAPRSTDIRWVVIEKGFGFSAGEPSKSSVIVRSVPIGFPDDHRETLLTEISNLWQDVIGCTANEIVVTALDGPLPI